MRTVQSVLLVDPDSPVVDGKRRRQCLDPPSSFADTLLRFYACRIGIRTLVEKGQRQRTTATRTDDDDDDDDGRSARPVGLRSQARHDDDDDEDNE